MTQTDLSKPKALDLYRAGLVATALVYVAGTIIYSVMLFFLSASDGFAMMVQSLVMFATVGIVGAALIATLITAPLAVAFGSAILRYTAPGWWQGPLTGALVTLTFETGARFSAREPVLNEWGNVIMLGYPVVLAMIAGWLVQRFMLEWPGGEVSSPLVPA